MSQLIEDYLRAKGVRYFRGHHDDEYFFLVDVLTAGWHGRLHVHLEGGRSREVAVSITPGRYFPADRRGRLGELADRWSAGFTGARVVFQPSSDPALVGVLACNLDRPADEEALGEFVDGTVASAVELFVAMMQATETSMPPARLRDAG